MLWELENMQKETALSQCNQLGPIYPTNVIMRLFEKLVFKLEMSANNYGHDQFAYKVYSNTTTALLICGGVASPTI